VLSETQYSYRNSFVDGIGTTKQDKLDDEVEKYRHLEELAELFLKAKQHHHWHRFRTQLTSDQCSCIADCIRVAIPQPCAMKNASTAARIHNRLSGKLRLTTELQR
jgi:hypothetical protein